MTFTYQIVYCTENSPSFWLFPTIWINFNDEKSVKRGWTSHIPGRICAFVKRCLKQANIDIISARDDARLYISVAKVLSFELALNFMINFAQMQTLFELKITRKISTCIYQTKYKKRNRKLQQTTKSGVLPCSRFWCTMATQKYFSEYT